VLAVGGRTQPVGPNSVAMNYTRRHNPLDPLEAELEQSRSPIYRLKLYLRGARSTGSPPIRAVYALAGANSSFRVEALREVGGFDERFRFGSEDTDLCRRLRTTYEDSVLLYDNRIVVSHHFAGTLNDTLRRSRAYGRGSASLWLLSEGSTLTLFPFPLALVCAAIFLCRTRRGRVLVPLVPLALYPRGASAFRNRSPSLLLDSYLQLLTEAAANVGLAQGIYRIVRGSAQRRRHTTSDGAPQALAPRGSHPAP
jgi:hypothetical protein